MRNKNAKNQGQPIQICYISILLTQRDGGGPKMRNKRGRQWKGRCKRGKKAKKAKIKGSKIMFNSVYMLNNN